MSSLLSARITPPVPPASQAYEPLARHVLRHRLQYDILMPSFVFSWIVTTLWVGWMLGGVSAIGISGSLVLPFLPRTIAFASLFWMSNMVPIIVLRKVYLTAESNTASSPLQTIKSAFSKSTTFRVLSVYTACAAAATALHVSMTYLMTGSDPRLHVFVKSRKHPYYLNGRFLFVVLAQLALAASYHLRNIMLGRFAVNWKHARPSSAKGSALFNHFARTFQATIISAIFALLVFSTYVAAFGLARTLVLPLLFRIPVLSLALRPFCAHFLRGPWTIGLLPRHFALVARTCVLSFTTVLSWEFAESLFDEKIHEPLSTTPLSPDAPTSLVAGATSLDPYFRYLAYWELDDLAKDDAPRRAALFADQKHAPALWPTLVREALLVLGRDYQRLLRRGAPAPAPAPALTPKPHTPAVPTTPLLRTPIFKTGAPHASPVAQVLDALAADGAVPQALERVRVPEIFRAAEGVVADAVANANGQASSNANAGGNGKQNGNGNAGAEGKVDEGKGKEGNGNGRGLLARLAVCAGVGVVSDWWCRERLSKRAEVALPHRDTDALIVEALSHLVCASLTEDRYGVVQRDIPRILEAMLSFLSAIEAYQAELHQSQPQSQFESQVQSQSQSESQPQSHVQAQFQAESAQREELAAADDVLATVGDVLKEGVVRIVRTFGDKLGAFAFPPHVARKLQGFVDYN
ncbi:hypothetical protein DENSPDRAFT_867789 [Dentipellis sp. KUC8613]|nr:hypothetical protein DENSPDRAFT_867789 [Dentipellis sp. KUC8613]